MSGVCRAGERIGYSSLGFLLAGNALLDFTECSLITCHILGKGVNQVLGILGSEDNARLHLCHGRVGSDDNEVYKEIIRAVAHQSKVGVCAAGYFGAYFDFNLVGVLIVFFHIQIQFAFLIRNGEEPREELELRRCTLMAVTLGLFQI